MRFVVAGLVAAAMVGSAGAAVIGTNPPSEPVTAERVASLPQSQRGAWTQYLERSQRQMKADKDALQVERKQVMSLPAPQLEGHGARSIPLDRAAEWYSSEEARHIGDVVVSYQTPAGGWSKNLEMSKRPRQAGESYTFGGAQTARPMSPEAFRMLADVNWSYVGTIDNDATITQIRYLAKVVTAIGPDSAGAAKYRNSFLRGLDYLLAAQYPNGGWPQVWPLEGGYHDGITFNDDAMIQVMELLQGVAAGRDEFAFVPTGYRHRADASVQKGIDCILKTQIVVKGEKTVWCQQHDPLTMKPASARNFEMPSQSAAESAGILMFLMNLSHPTDAQVEAINSAATWLMKVAIKDHAFRPTAEGRALVAAPGAPLIWARYYEIGTDKPIFGDRDKSIHDRVDEISTERRNGYAWYGTAPREALQQYTDWRRLHVPASVPANGFR